MGHLKLEEGFREAFRGVIDIDIYLYIIHVIYLLYLSIDIVDKTIIDNNIKAVLM